ncbi:hypothetical protein T4E_1380 [Trichinella pseudospiralis]|uniref:Uncharacterized protein n=1 Tax=Trichinella pseudospiralis TaxID=6337 RepID=A0A0V0Y3Q7_TRIPS|nr:hypothetical protein T4E_1380 [Trichinella pseudospiralis]
MLTAAFSGSDIFTAIFTHAYQTDESAATADADWREVALAAQARTVLT